MPKTFYSYSFGCRVNQAEQEVLNSKLQRAGFRFQKDNADIYIINSCAVTQKAEREVKQLIYQLRKKSPQAKIVLTGCSATLWEKNNIVNDKIDLLVNNTNKKSLVDLLSNFSKSPQSSQPPLFPSKYSHSKRVLFKIQDGCHRFCTYCVVPYLRGLPKSEPIKSVISQIKQHEKYFNEAILVSVNTEAYGQDTKESLLDLLKAVLNDTNIRRISFGSVHPWSITQEFIDFYSDHFRSNRLVRFLHIPVQSGSNKILKLMKRGYTKEAMLKKLNELQKIDPFLFLGTDIITGFLQETDRDFQETYDFLERSPIAKFHVFRFSLRNHTAAYHLQKTLKEPSALQKKLRAQALIKLAKQKYQAFLEKHIDQTFPAMFIRKHDDSTNEALLINQISVTVQSDNDLTGQIKHVKINSLLMGKLFGRIV